MLHKIPRVTHIIYKATGLHSFLREIFKTENFCRKFDNHKSTQNSIILLPFTKRLGSN